MIRVGPRAAWLAVVLAVLCAPIEADHIVRGTIRDAHTGEALPATTVQVVGTYRATIANDEGEYALQILSLPASVRVVCIGYHTLVAIIAFW